MKKILLPVFLLLFSLPFVAFGQLIESFDNSTSDSLWQTNFESAPSSMDVSNNTTDKVEGSASLYVDAKIASLNDWGSYDQYIYALPDGATPLDWSISDTLSIWVKVMSQVAHPEYMVFRIQIGDKTTADDPMEQYIYENLTILDNVHDWVQLKVPLKEIESDGTYIPDSTGFVIAPNSWGGFTYNDRKLNLDKIVQFQLGIIVSGYTAGTHLPADSIQCAFDGFERTGSRAIPAIIFNGVAVPSGLGQFDWGGSSLELIEKAGVNPVTNALKWTLGDAWSGSGWNIDPAFNLAGAWQQDSISFDMKAESGVLDTRLQFEDGAAKMGIKFSPIDDNAWHHYSYALKDFVPQDGTSGFDSSKVTVFQILAEGTAVSGKVLYLDNIWTGKPEFDVIAPVAVENASVVAGSFTNLVTWTDVPGESGEKYTVYASKSPISDIEAPGVDVVALNVAEDVQAADHVLIAPATNQDVTYYYAVKCIDKAGNPGPIASAGQVTNTAQGVAVINWGAPTNFAADGDLSDWAGIKPFRMFPSDGSGTIVTNTIISGDDDLSVNAYLAMTSDYLYVAFDVNDDIISPDISESSWLNDCCDLFFGLYEYQGKTHVGYKREVTPDYHMRFLKSKLIYDNPGADSLLVPGEDYYWDEKFPSGYVVEAKISFQDIAKKKRSASADPIFVAKEGMEIPIDFEISDADNAEREGQLDYSKDADGNSYQDVTKWAATFIGDNAVGVNDNPAIVNTFNLEQNYPNPFNPTTQIKYSIAKAGLVNIKVYDVLGRQVAELINHNQNVGEYTVNFNASNLTSGVYLYKIESGSFTATKKMMLLK